jgi:hypothetical protein
VTSGMIRRFNRDTGWLATGVLGTVAFAALVLAVRERRSEADDLTKASSLDHAITQTSPKENPSSQMEAAASTQTPVDALTSVINQHDMQANAGSRTPAQRRESRQVIEPRLHRASSRSRSRFVDLKMRLSALWHQSLARRERSHSWTQLANWNTKF